MVSSVIPLYFSRYFLVCYILFDLCACAKSLQSCPTLCDPMDFSSPGSSVLGILQTRLLEWVAMPSSRGYSRVRDRNCISYVSCIAALTNSFSYLEPVVAHQAPLSMGFSRQEYWSRLPFPSPGDLPNPGIEPGSPALQTDLLPAGPPGKP